MLASRQKWQEGIGVALTNREQKSYPNYAARPDDSGSPIGFLRRGV